MKVSFSLAAKKQRPSGTVPPLKQPIAFGGFDDDRPVDAAPTASSSTSASKVDVNKQLAAQSANAKLSKSLKRRMEEEKNVDSTVFEYDEVWDKMQEVKQRQREAKEVDSKARKPKYINALLQSAGTRRLDHVRAEEKMIQREREAEGDEFANKEQFVTQAYKDQMIEVRKAEEEEKIQEALEKARQKSTGLTHLYRQMLEQSEEKHSATVAATLPSTSKRVIGPQGLPEQNLTISKPPDFTPLSDLQLAAQARVDGKEVELNDDNQIVDKRELLSAGLNLSAPNTRRLGLQRAKSKVGADNNNDNKEEVQAHRAVGTAASRREINERRMREIQQQMVDEEARVQEQKQREEEERTKRIVAKRNTENDVSSARERYLERKRRKLEEAHPIPGTPTDTG